MAGFRARQCVFTVMAIRVVRRARRARQCVSTVMALRVVRRRSVAPRPTIARPPRRSSFGGWSWGWGDARREAAFTELQRYRAKRLQVPSCSSSDGWGWGGANT